MNARGEDYRTALVAARRNGHRAVVQLLLDNGAVELGDTSESDWEIDDSEYQSEEDAEESEHQSKDNLDEIGHQSEEDSDEIEQQSERNPETLQQGGPV